MRETTALGAAIAAGLAVGLWRNFAELRDINRSGGAVFEPQITRQESASKFGEWEKAVRMCRGWIGANHDNSKNATCTNGAVETKTHAVPVPSMKVERSAPNSIKTKHTSSLMSDIVAAGVGATLKVKTRLQNEDAEFLSIKTPLISISGDLDSADEEDLFLELRKVEILQKLKKIRKLKVGYY